ncbi:MAG: DUF885 domain-containing protein [Planctomycetes bacterium]|nr:DUF885 domain-containing protein [Planctomycetota bacterium]
MKSRSVLFFFLALSGISGLWSCKAKPTADDDHADRPEAETPAARTETPFRRANDPLGRLSADLRETFFRFWPTRAIGLGIHREDAVNLEDFSEESVARYVRALKEYAEDIEKLEENAESSSRDWRLEFDSLETWIENEIYTFDEAKSHLKSPAFYAKWLGRMSQEIARSNALAADRKKEILEHRLSTMNDFTAIAELNLVKGRPHRKEIVEETIEAIEGVIEEFGTAYEIVRDELENPEKAKDIEAALEKGKESLGNFVSFLQGELSGAVARTPMDREDYVRMLAVKHRIFRDPDLIASDVLRYLDDIQQQTIEHVDHYYEGMFVSEAMEAIGASRSLPDTAFGDFGREMQALRSFTIDKELVALPESLEIEVRGPPANLRGTYLAELRSPGPYDSAGSKWYFNLPEMEAGDEGGPIYGKYARPLVIANLVYPGFGTLAYFATKCESDARKIFECNIRNKGWQHYSEQIVTDFGYGGSDPGYRLQQLYWSSWRAVRTYVSVKLNSGAMSVDEAKQFLRQRGGMDDGEIEWVMKFAISDTDELGPCYGKLRILRLRNLVRKRDGNEFSMQRFHREFLEVGYGTFEMVERYILGEAVSKDEPLY